MNKEWYSAKELVGVGSFPSTPQAINQRAKAEGMAPATAQWRPG
ncbi:Uncharacterised protein [Edwardsiella tarda]|nr:Uncharacterised protein [Edwardsiella tarda]